jgi:hypothetical protein
MKSETSVNLSKQSVNEVNGVHLIFKKILVKKKG